MAFVSDNRCRARRSSCPSHVRRRDHVDLIRTRNRIPLFTAVEGLSWDICLPYLDGIAIWASGPDSDTAFEQALSRLDLVLERLEWAGLTCKPTKCTLFTSQVEYLGHVCSREGVSLDPAKTRRQRHQGRVHHDIGKVRSFLARVMWILPPTRGNYHVISAPLVELTKLESRKQLP